MRPCQLVVITGVRAGRSSSQADDVLHRQITRHPDLLSLEDMPPPGMPEPALARVREREHGQRSHEERTSATQLAATDGRADGGQVLVPCIVPQANAASVDCRRRVASVATWQDHSLMSWTAVSATVLPLVGVALGTAGTLFGLRYATQAELQRDSLQRAEAKRVERKEAIIGYLSAAERIEQLRGGTTHDGGPSEGTDVGELTHALWLAKKFIELVCSAQLAQAAQDYTRELDRCTWALASKNWTGASRALSAREHELRVEFMEAARRELGYAGEPLQRRTRNNPL